MNDTEDPQPAEETWNLRLYVAGQTTKSLTAVANLKKVCEEHLAGKYTIEVVDLLLNPQLAGATKSWQFRPWCANCLNLYVRSSATFPIRSASSSACNSRPLDPK